MSDAELKRLGISTHQVEVRQTILMPKGSFKTTRLVMRKVSLAGREYDDDDDADTYGRRHRKR
jgi:hypothetical protein